MTPISDFSDNPKYTIKAVSVQTGIRPITLRAWERRYEVLTPSRSDNRYRLYSDRDIAILRWVQSRMSNGVSISMAVTELRQITDTGNWPESIPLSKPITPAQAAAPPELYARELFQTLKRHDEAEAENLLRETFSFFDLKTVLFKILTPCLVDIGEAWVRGEIRITTEHFASAFLRGKLLTLLQAYPHRRNAPLILLGGAPTEQHEIGALMMAVLLRSDGYRVEFLGPDIPLDDLVEHARYEKPNLIILTATTRTSALGLTHMQEKISRLKQVPVFGYGGLAFNVEPGLRLEVPGIFLGESMDDALAKIGEILSSSTHAKSNIKKTV